MATTPPERSRIVFTTFGSLGDLHPYIALALGMKARGHDAVIATLAMYREKVEAEGIEFRLLRASHVERFDGELMKRAMDLHKGPAFIIRDLLMPNLRVALDDTLAAAAGADFLVSHHLTFATPLVAEKRGLPWALGVISPMGFFSCQDPPVLAPPPFLSKLARPDPAFRKPMLLFVKAAVRAWGQPWRRLRGELGLPPAGDPLFEGMHSSDLVLALFSPLLGAPQPDWPASARVVGFPFYDRPGGGLAPELAAFLDDGPPPVVFTLGSSAVMDAGRFYEYGLTAARKLGRRAVLLLGSDPNNRPASPPEGVLAAEYAPFSELFPRAAAIVHHGGVGTTAQAMCAGVPMLVVPYAHDQPDNAARVVRLGIARTVTRGRYTADRAATELRRLLDDPGYAERAGEVGRRIQTEDGVRNACDAMEDVLRRKKSPPSAIVSSSS